MFSDQYRSLRMTKIENDLVTHRIRNTDRINPSTSQKMYVAYGSVPNLMIISYNLIFILPFQPDPCYLASSIFDSYLFIFLLNAFMRLVSPFSKYLAVQILHDCQARYVIPF